MSAMNQDGTEPTKGRDTCESALREQGIDEVLIAKKLKVMLEAKNRRWNPEKKSWEEFDGCDTQLAAIWEIAKTLDAYRSRRKDHRVPIVFDMSNFPPRKERADPPE